MLQPSPSLYGTDPPLVICESVPSSSQNHQHVEAETKRCVNFLNTLLQLAKQKRGSEMLSAEVSRLVSELLEGHINPQKFTEQIQLVLKSKPQPQLLPFLQKTLPLVRKAYYNGDCVFEGLAPTTAPSIVQQSFTKSPSSQISDYSSRYDSSVTKTITSSSLDHHSSSLNSLIPNAPTASPMTGSYLIDDIIGVRPTLQQQMTGSPSTIRIAPLLDSPMIKQDFASRSPEKLPDSLAGTQLPQPLAESSPKKYRDTEDDFNDVTTMGGVNLSEESQMITPSTAEILSTETRTCGQVDYFLLPGPLESQINAVTEKHGLQDVTKEVLFLLSQATKERLKDLVERLAVISEHRSEVLMTSAFYDQVTDARSQFRFLRELSEKESQKREEREKEIVLKMAKIKSLKDDNVEQQKLIQRAKELQKAEHEEIRNRDANIAAQLALSSSRKRPAPSTFSGNDSFSGTNGSPSVSTSISGAIDPSVQKQVTRPRYKRVNCRDLQTLLSMERQSRRSRSFYQSFYK